MKVLRGRTVYLPAYFEDSNNDPVTGGSANVTFYWKTTDNASSGNAAATAELGGGWYNYLYTDTVYKPIVYWATMSGYKNFPGGIVEHQNLVYTTSTVTKTNTTAVQSLFIIAGTRCVIRGIMLDLVNLTKDTIITVKERIDGTNLRTIASITWNTTMDPGIHIGEIYTSNMIYVYAQSLILEGASRSIPYQYHYELLS